MIRNLIVLPDGTEVFSGADTTNAIVSTKLTACVNDSKELSIGSVCSNALEMTILTPKAALSLTAGDEVTLYKVDSSGNRLKKGKYILEKPTRPTANTMKITGYDRVTKLDKDLTAWLSALSGWPYTLSVFAGMVCEACGLTLVAADIPNGDFPVYQFTKAGVTGRKLMKWIGEICCRFCRANNDGNIEFAWYKPSGVTIAHTGERYYFQRALTYETYGVAPIDAVQIRLADGSSGALWPEADEEANSYIITGNAILMARITEDLLPYLGVIEQELAGVSYTPCKISLPACLDIDAGSIVDITDKNGATITAYVMTKTTSGQKDTLECTGSARRDSSTAVNNQTKSPDQAAQDAFAGLTQSQIFNKLTDNGKIQGIYAQDGVWYVNAAVAKVVNLSAESIDTTNLKVAAANITGTLTAAQIDATNLKVKAANITGKLTAAQIDATNLKVKAANITGKLTADQIDATNLKVSAANITGTLTVKDTSGDMLLSAGNNAVRIAGWKADSNSLYSGSSFSSAECFLCTGSAGAFNIGNSGYISGWMIKAGSKFGVTKAGAVWCSDIHATGGTIGDWTIQDGGLSSGSLPPPWAASSEDAETITIKKWGVFRSYYDSYDGDDHSEYAYWNWIIGCAREWAISQGLI